MVSGTDRPAMTIAVDLGRKATTQTNKDIPSVFQPQLHVKFTIMNSQAAKKTLDPDLMA